MTTRARGVRLPEELDEEIERELERTGRNWSQTVVELLREAIRMRRVPGVVFASGPTGRRAQVAGTGLDVWELIASYKAAGEEWEALLKEYPWLTSAQLRAALAYYELYPGEIDERLERENEWTPERVYERHPYLRPPGAVR